MQLRKYVTNIERKDKTSVPEERINLIIRNLINLEDLEKSNEQPRIKFVMPTY